MTATYRYSPDAKREMAQFHHDAATAVNATNAVSPDSLQATQGPISFAADTATTNTGQSRASAYQATAGNSQQMGDLLQQAAQAYERGDTEAAERLRAQAERLGASDNPAAARGTGPGGTSPSGTPAGTPAAADGGGAQAAGQMMGQFSQMAGQMMQGVTQPVQGAVQGLTQIPQQVLQGVQGIVEAATQGAAGGAGAAAGAEQEALDKASGKEDKDEKDGKEDKHAGAEGKKHGERAPVDGANKPDNEKQTQSNPQVGNRAGAGTGTGGTPDPAANRGANAPTHPM